jgi:hypothetical protein
MIIGEESFIIKKTYDERGHLIIEEVLNIDSTRNGYYKEFTLGRIKDSGNYKNGKKDGSWYYWDLSGDIVKKENWFLGKQFGEQIDYYSRKNLEPKSQIYKYGFNNIEGARISEIKFDTEGSPIDISGFPLYCAYNGSRIGIGEIYELICFWGVPNDFEWLLTVKEKEKNKNNILSEKKFSRSSQNMELVELPFARKYLSAKQYKKSGEYEWIVSLNIKLNTGQILVNDSTIIELKVR